MRLAVKLIDKVVSGISCAEAVESLLKSVVYEIPEKVVDMFVNRTLSVMREFEVQEIWRKERVDSSGDLDILIKIRRNIGDLRDKKVGNVIHVGVPDREIIKKIKDVWNEFVMKWGFDIFIMSKMIRIW